MAAAAGARWKIDVDIVVFGVDGFLNERLVKDSVVDFNEIIGLHHVAFCSHRRQAHLHSHRVFSPDGNMTKKDMTRQTSWTDRHPFHGLFSRTTWVSCHQKGYTSLDFNEARDDGVAVASAGPYTNHLPVTPDK